jgi:hypothetical protein
MPLHSPPCKPLAHALCLGRRPCDQHEFLTEPLGSDSTCHKAFLGIVQKSVGPVCIASIDQLHLSPSHRGTVDLEPHQTSTDKSGLLYRKPSAFLRDVIAAFSWLKASWIDWVAEARSSTHEAHVGLFRISEGCVLVFSCLASSVLDWRSFSGTAQPILLYTLTQLW